MHTLRMLLIGFAVLAIFVAGAHAINKRGERRVNGARAFIWVWLIAAFVNMGVGVVKAGVPVHIELGVLAVVFGLPALAAWLIARKQRAPAG
jgi:hypothetical protein